MTEQRATITNYSTMIFLINPKCRAIMAIYEPDSEGKTDATTKSKREMFKTFDPMVSVGDMLIVPSGTRLGFTTVKVVEVDVECDLESSIQVKWVAGIIDLDGFENTKRLEDQAIARVKSAKANAAREELRKQLLADIDPAAMETLQIAHMGETPPAAPQTRPAAEPDTPAF